jgi:hypothetical protein
MAASNTRFTQNSLGQSKNPIDSDHGIYRDLRTDLASDRHVAKSLRHPLTDPCQFGILQIWLRGPK